MNVNELEEDPHQVVGSAYKNKWIPATHQVWDGRMDEKYDLMWQIYGTEYIGDPGTFHHLLLNS
jgi:hypothetical protein